MFKSIVKAAVLAFAVQCAHAAFPPLEVRKLPPGGISQCGQITFGWTGGMSPYKLYLMNGTAGLAIKVFPIQLSHSMDWKVDLPAGTTFIYHVESGPDENGAIQAAHSVPYTILDSSDRSCINTAIHDDGSEQATPSPIGHTSFTMVPAPTSALGSSSPHKLINRTSLIVGSVLGGLAFLLLMALGLLCLFRRKSKVVESQIIAEQKAKDLEVGDETEIQKNPAGK
jgi:hypothetical protein